ncbi:MAG: FAD-dependent monooxygenase [Rhodobacteraceae bacterium]|nr:FAD-dependent monooxygenase [Paracoccaceae bacterium]
MARRLKVAIVGAGIGGMTAAGALHRMGHEVVVLERAPELGEVGAGLQLGPNAVKVIEALGLNEAITRTAAEPVDMVSIKWDDATLRYREPLKEISVERYGARYLMAHRADLHALLCSVVPEASINLGWACAGVRQSAGAAEAVRADGATLEADVVIGADGIHSAVRTALFGPMPARFTNQICWRAQVHVDDMPRRVGPGGSVALKSEDYVGWIGPTGHVLFYEIRPGKVLNIFAGRVSEGWAEESWAIPSSREEMIAAYAGWNDAMLEVFTKVDHVYRWGIYDRDPLKRWTEGRVTLLGDAAHPMMPTLAQGAAMSMEDGFALARWLDAMGDDPKGALVAYEAERLPRTGRVQIQARQQFENNRKTPTPPALSRDWIFEHDATTLRHPGATATAGA